MESSFLFQKHQLDSALEKVTGPSFEKFSVISEGINFVRFLAVVSK